MKTRRRRQIILRNKAMDDEIVGNSVEIGKNYQ